MNDFCWLSARDTITVQGVQKMYLILVAILIPTQLFAVAKNELTQDDKKKLISLFATEFDNKLLTDFFNQSKLEKIPQVIPKNVFNKQVQRNYDNFHDSYSKNLARKFYRKWRTRLANAEKKYSVDKEVIVAILLVETGLGAIKGKYHVPSVFSSIALSSKEQLEAESTKEQLEAADQKKYVEKLERKIKWAHDELKVLITLYKNKKGSVFNLYGSSSGAFGLCQFLPSSYSKYAVDGDGKGGANLYHEADAIPSVANYLKGHGWVKGLQNPANRKAVYAYNHSEIYVDNVLKVA